ncbi:hypothetical protein D3C71_1930090 [compost metagenome]
MGIEDCGLTAITHRQVGDQQGVFWLELAADQVDRRHRQLQALGMIDLVAAQRCQLPADAAKDVRIRDEVSLPVEGADTARIQVGEPFL